MGLPSWGQNQILTDVLFRTAQQGRQDIYAVLAFQGLEILPGERHKGGQHIDIADELTGFGSRLNLSRPAGDERNAVTTFPDTEFKAKQVTIN